MKTLTTKITRTVLGLGLFAAICLNAGCGSDFYLSESEAAAYAAPFTSETGANNLFANSIIDPTGQDPNRTLRITFDNTVSPPAIQSTNLAPLLRSYSNYGLTEGVNRQIQLDRLTSQLQAQASNWIQNELQLYAGANGAGVQLTRLNSITLSFVTKPAFVFHPDTQSIEFHAKVRLTIDGTLTVDALDFFTNWLAGGINGTYPLNIVIQDLDLNGTASFDSGFADASDIAIAILPTVGTVNVFDGTGSTSAAPSTVKDGVRDTVKTQLSVPLNQSFLQRYDYFGLGSIGLSTTGASGPSLQYTYRDFPENAKPMEHVVARSSDGNLYYFRKTEGGQGVTSLSRPFPTLDRHIENEPTLIASAADQLELAATTVTGDLAYADLRDETWTNQTIIPPSAAGKNLGKPAIVASSPGQVEIIVATQSGRLYHFRRINGLWLPTAAIPTTKGPFVPTLPLRNPCAVQTGNKIVLVAVDGANRPFAMVFDMESGSWGYALELSTQQTTTFAPAIAASGNGTVDVVYVGLNKAPFHRRLTVQAGSFNPAAPVPGFTLDPTETSIGGVLNASPSLQSSGLHQLELVGRSTDNRLYHNRFVGDVSPAGTRFGRTIRSGWQGWNDLNGNFAGTLTFEQMSAFSTAVSGSGKLSVAAITTPSAIDTDLQQLPYLNSYDAERFGTQPWNTVLWRGYEQAGTKRFIGQPAVAVTDRNTTLTYVNTSYQVKGGRVTDNDDPVAFNSLVSSPQVISSTPVDPVIATSLPGTTDVITVSPEGALRHVRWFGKTSWRTSLLTQPNSVLFQKQPAVVAYGNGFLEVAAVSTTGTLWHWRYLNGSWTAPVQVPGNVISRPSLVNFGSGQLMLLALGTDRRPYFWEFNLGVWLGFWRAPTNLVISESYFSPQSIAGWGDGTIDLAMVEYGSGALYHGRFSAGMLNATPIGEAFKYVGGVLADVPVLTAVSPYREIVLAIGTDHRVYSASTVKVAASQLNPLGIQWSGYFGMGGAGNRLSSIARVGANEMTVAGIDASGNLSVSRYNGAVWSQFQPIVGQNSNSFAISALYRPQMAGF